MLAAEDQLVLTGQVMQLARGSATEPKAEPKKPQARKKSRAEGFVGTLMGVAQKHVPNWHLGKWNQRLNPNPGSVILSHSQMA